MSANVSHIAGNLGRLTDRLDGVRRAGKGYTAKCPAHGDKTASLSLSEGENGAVLLHCFAGCEPADVLGAVGLTLADLFPERLKPATPQERREALRYAREGQWSAALATLLIEATIVQIAAEELRRGNLLSDSDRARLDESVERLESARGVLRGS